MLDQSARMKHILLFVVQLPNQRQNSLFSFALADGIQDCICLNIGRGSHRNSQRLRPRPGSRQSCVFKNGHQHLLPFICQPTALSLLPSVWTLITYLTSIPPVYNSTKTAKLEPSAVKKKKKREESTFISYFYCIEILSFSTFHSTTCFPMTTISL